MTTDDINEFQSYLQNCTTQQIENIIEKEESAGRFEYVTFALIELGRRINIVLTSERNMP